MAQIRWDNVNEQPKSVQGFLGAGELLNRAGTGFRQTAKDLFKLRDMESDFVTNQAIRDAMYRGVDPSGITDPRVDFGLLEDAVMGRRKNLELIQTEDLTQEGLGYTNAINKFKSNVPRMEANEAMERLVQATGINRDQAAIRESDSGIALNTVQSRLAEATGARAADDYEEQEESEKQIRALNQFLPQIEDQYYNQLVQQNLPAGVEPTQAQMADFRIKAKALAQGAEGRAAVDDFIQANQFDPAALEKSVYGPIMASELAAQQAIAIDRQKRAEIADEALTEFQRNVKIGNLSNAIFRDGKMQAGIPDDIKTEKIKNYTEAVNYLGSAGFNVSQLTDDKENKAVLERALAQFPNHSLFVQSVGSYIAKDGELDREKLSSAIGKVGGAAIFAEINRQREAKGLPPIAEEAAPGAAGTAQTTTKPRTREEVQASVAQLQTSMAEAKAKLDSIDPATPGYRDLVVAFDKVRGIKPVDPGAGLREASAQPDVLYRTNALAEFDAAFNAIQSAATSRYEHALLQSLSRPQ